MFGKRKSGRRATVFLLASAFGIVSMALPAAAANQAYATSGSNYAWGGTGAVGDGAVVSAAFVGSGSYCMGNIRGAGYDAVDCSKDGSATFGGPFSVPAGSTVTFHLYSGTYWGGVFTAVAYLASASYTE